MPNDTPTQTTLADLRKPIAPEVNLPQVRAGFGDLQSFELAQRAAKLLASSSLVPQQYQGNIANCVIALEMAQRIGASALMVMQNLYVVHGRPAWSAQFMVAAFNQSGRFSAIRYEWQSTEGKDDWGCRAWAMEKSTNERITGPLVTIKLAKAEKWYEKNGSKWQTMPQLMLMYRAASWFVRAYAPEITMGLHTADEITEIYDAAPNADGQFQVTTTELQVEPAPAQPLQQPSQSTTATGGGPNEDELFSLASDAAESKDWDTARDLLRSMKHEGNRKIIEDQLPKSRK